MGVKVVITGLDELKRNLGSAGKQVAFAASKALNTTAFAVQKELKDEMQRVFQGGATPYALRAFKVEKATKAKLESSVGLRTDAPAAGTPYDQAFAHLMTSGVRRWKRLEGYLLGAGFMPEGMMAVPGKDCPLDARGNIPRTFLREIIADMSVIGPRPQGKGKGARQRPVAYFSAMPGNHAGLPPGIYRRKRTADGIETSILILFLRPMSWRRFIDLEEIAIKTVAKTFHPEFQAALAAALATAK